jgi:hypothetical protein
VILSSFTYGYSQRHPTPVLSKAKTALPLTKATVYIQVELPPSIPPMHWAEAGNLVPSPMHWGGLGWRKTLVNQLFQTCVYTVAFARGEAGNPIPSPMHQGGLGWDKAYVGQAFEVKFSALPRRVYLT